MIVKDYKENMSPELVALIQKHAYDFDTSYLDFVNNFMEERPKIFMMDDGATFLAFLEMYTGIEGPGSIRSFLADLVKQTPILKWETAEKCVEDQEFRKKAFNLEEMIGDLNFRMESLWNTGVDDLGLDTIIDYQTKGNLGKKLPGYQVLLSSTIPELRESGIDWYVPIETRDTNCPGIEELRSKSGRVECLHALRNYSKYEDGKVYLNKKNSIKNSDYSWEAVFVPISRIVDGHEQSNDVQTWLKKDDALLLGYKVL